MQDIVNDIKKISLKLGNNVFIVGGYIRDKLADPTCKPKDMDIVVDGDIKLFMEAMRHQGFKACSLNQEVSLYRAFKNGNTVDIMLMKKDTMEEDLRLRDFTVNAIALDIINNKILDPFNGRKALQRRILDTVTEESFKDDPVRILRGIRLSMEKGMHFSEKSEKLMIQERSRISQCAMERVSGEILSIIAIDKYGDAFSILDQYDVLRHVIPYVQELKTIGKCKYHMVDAFTHMNMTYKAFKEALAGLVELSFVSRLDLKAETGQHQVQDYLAFGAFAHDIGKFQCYSKNDNHISFKGHDSKGAEIIQDVCRNLRFPRKMQELVEAVVKAHMVPLRIYKCKGNEYEQQCLSFFMSYERFVPYVLLISYCDAYATRSLYDPENDLENYHLFIEKLMMEYDRYDNIVKHCLPGGEDMMREMNVSGRDVGLLLEEAVKVAYVDKINDKDCLLEEMKRRHSGSQLK